MLKKLSIQTSCSVFILTSMFISDAHAYIDPGSGSILLQLILGGIAGVGVVVKLYWDRVKTRYQSLFGQEEKAHRNE